MNIVVLDGYTLNPGDLGWDGLESLGSVTVHDRTPAELTVSRAVEADIVLTNKTVLDARVLGCLPRLKYVGLLATGYNVVDVACARERGIPVANVPAYGTQAVAQMVLAHVLNLAQRVGEHAGGVARGKWAASPDFCYWDYPLVELTGQVMGIVGFGRIGRATAKLAQAFGMRVMAFDVDPQAGVGQGVEMVELDQLFVESDVVSLHCPLTDESQALVCEGRLGQMKRTAFLVNTSRGPLVDEQALADALNGGHIAGAGLDVLCREPPDAANPLLTARNCYVTPHISWATRAARVRLMETAVANVGAFIASRPQNVVNPA